MRQPRTARGAAIKASAVETGRYWLQRAGLAALLLVALLSAVNVLTLSGTAQVVELGGSQGLALHNRQTYEAAANRLLAASVWDRNKITISTAKISRQLRAQFPELDSVSVTLPLLAHRPLIYVEPAQAALILTGSNGAFIVGNSGKVLVGAANQAALPALKLPVVNDQSGLKLRVGQQALAGTTVSFIREVVAQLAAKHFSVTGMTLPPAASEVDMGLAGQPYQVKFNLHNSDTARQQAGTFLATIAQLGKQGVTPAQYVDVRVPGRAYYQ